MQTSMVIVRKHWTDLWINYVAYRMEKHVAEDLAKGINKRGTLEAKVIEIDFTNSLKGKNNVWSRNTKNNLIE